MPTMENVKCLVEIFNERFRIYDLILTAEDVERGSGVIENGDDGWPLELPYRFGVDADGDYIDYYFSYSYHQMTPDHIRIRCDHRDEQLPVQEPGYSYPSDTTEKEKTRRGQEHYTENRRISGMLCAKGFEPSQKKENVPVQVVYVSRRDKNGAWITTEEMNFEWRGNYDEALGAAMWLVDDALLSLHRHGMTAAELLMLYRTSGPDPYIRYENRSLARAANPISAGFVIYQPIPFNAWGYAETASHRLCGSPLAEPSRTLAGWQGRYDRFDKQRMESQLFLDRTVWLNRDIRHSEIWLLEGATGKITGHNRYVDTDNYNYSCEVPVMFEVNTLPFWERMLNCFRSDTPLVVAVPFDAIEFAESDEVYSAHLDEVFAEIR